MENPVKKIYQIIGSVFTNRATAEDVAQNNPSIKTFDNIQSEEDRILSQSVINNMYSSSGGDPLNNSVTDQYTKVVYGQVNGQKQQRLMFYKQMGGYPEVSEAMDEIADAFLNYDEQGQCVTLEFNEKAFRSTKDTNLSTIKSELQNEFGNFVKMYDFDNDSYAYIRDFLTDGELTWENIIDDKNTALGIIGVKRIPAESYEYLFDNMMDYQGIIFNAELLGAAETAPTVGYDKTKFNNRFNTNTAAIAYGNFYKTKNGIGNNLLVLPKEQVTHINSGAFLNPFVVIPTLEKARRPYRQLSLLEDATIIHRLVRAPQRLVFNVSTGKLPPNRSEEVVKRMMQRYNTKKVYDPSTGDIVNGYDPTTMLESYWFPKPEFGGTEVTTLGGDSSFADMEPITYFQRKLYSSLKVPFNRFDPEHSGDNRRSADELTYEELRFAKFIIRLQQQFSKGLTESFKVHLKLNGMWEKYNLKNNALYTKFVEPTNFDLYEKSVRFTFLYDNYKKMADQEEFSKEYLMRNFLDMSDEQINENRRMKIMEEITLTKMKKELEDQILGGPSEETKPNEDNPEGSSSESKPEDNPEGNKETKPEETTETPPEEKPEDTTEEEPKSDEDISGVTDKEEQDSDEEERQKKIDKLNKEFLNIWNT